METKMIENVTDATFDTDVLKSETPVLVDFMADWCGPCQMLAPVLKEVAPMLEGKVKIVKMNIDSNPKVPAMLGIRSIPTLILYKDGKVHSSYNELMSKTKLLEWLKSV
ncbi:MAG: thioredoxin [Candidatus Paracaedibacteraceae bacterium]|nr:thioredoxin [Candidatus Paracaedibacteraceae bacterium]